MLIGLVRRGGATVVSVCLALVLVLTFMVTGAVGHESGSAFLVTSSTTVSSNPTCGDLVSGATEFKIEPVLDGTFTQGPLTVTIDVTDSTFNFTSNIGIDAVFVKGGPGGLLYTFDPEVTSATGLHAPTNPESGQFYGLSHVSFCFDVETATTTTTTATPTTTTTTTTTVAPTTTTATTTVETTTVTAATTVTAVETQTLVTTVAGAVTTQIVTQPVTEVVTAVVTQTEVVAPAVVTQPAPVTVQPTETVAGVQLPAAGGVPIAPGALAGLGLLLSAAGLTLRRFRR